MAVLPDPDRADALAQLMRHPKWAEIACGIIKGDLGAALNATDSWIDSNQASFNSNLPTAARNNLTQQQKTLLFCFVALKRAGLI